MSCARTFGTIYFGGFVDICGKEALLRGQCHVSLGQEVGLAGSVCTGDPCNLWRNDNLTGTKGRAGCNRSGVRQLCQLVVSMILLHVRMCRVHAAITEACKARSYNDNNDNNDNKSYLHRSPVECLMSTGSH